MKAFLFWALALMLACTGCDYLHKISLDGPRGTEGGGSESGSNPRDGESQTADTTICIAAVRVPDGYDWRRDSAGTALSCTLLFYRNNVLKLRLLTGREGRIDAQPDRHHIINGHLITEYSSLRGSVFKRDGETILETDGRDILAGLLEKDGHIYTLCRPAAGEGFVLRRDGEVLLKKGGGTPFGGFNKVTYDPNGALYMDDGKLCFGYRSLVDGNESVWLVRDGKETLVSSSHSARALDAKSINGKDCMAYNENGASSIEYDGVKADLGLDSFLQWTEGGVLMFDGEASIAGSFHIYCYALEFSGVGWGTSYLNGGTEVSEVYLSGTDMRPVSPGIESYEGNYFFSRGCGTLLGKHLYLALTPFDPDNGCSFLRRDGERVWTFPHNGYISAISLSTK